MNMKTKAEISLKAFSKASDNVRDRLIRQYGVYIDSYFNNDHLINIYALKEFFVEVVINIRYNNVVNYTAFERGFSVSLATA
jgi:hypothetical protein